nr:nucleolin [Hymenolepis microstoma]
MIDVSDNLLLNIRERIAEHNSRTIQVTHLPNQTRLKDLFKYFKTAINARFPTKVITGNRRYAFLEFASADAAEEALAKAKSAVFKGKLPRCETISHKTESGKVKNPCLYQPKDFYYQRLNISCLHRNTKESEIRALFPNLKSLIFPNQGPGKALGSARITFSDQASALSAFESLHGTVLHGSPLIVNFCLKKKSGISQVARTKKINATGKVEEEFKVLKDKKKAKKTFDKIKRTVSKKIK